MFSDFAGKFIIQLLQMDFLPAAKGSDNISNDTEVIFLFKNSSPVLYIVSVINGEKMSPAVFGEKTRNFFEHMEEGLFSYGCKSLIAVNILVYQEMPEEIIKFLDKIEYIPLSGKYDVWWGVDLKDKRFIPAESGPSRVADIEKEILHAFSNAEPGKDINIEALKRMESLRREQEIKSKKAVLTRVLIGINVVIFLIMFISGSAESLTEIFGVNGEKVFGGEYYRLITGMFLHGGIAHLGYNILSLYIFGSRAEKYLGHAEFLLVYLFSGIAGGILSSIFIGTSYSIGASGAIYGLLAAVLVLSRRKRIAIEGLDYFSILLIAIFGFFMGLLTPGVDNFAHIGGFLAGAFISFLFTLKKEK